MAADERAGANPQGSKSRKLYTVSVPDPVQEPFLRAQEYVERFFAQRTEDPAHSNISISGERYILVRAAGMSVEFFDLVTSLYADRGANEARIVAQNLLFDVAHALGRGDARAFHERMGVTDPIEKLSAGPIHFSFAGWAYVNIFPESRPSPDENYYLIYDHPFSFESDAWIKRNRKSEYPVCIMNAGYSSGWCEESFGLPLVAAEVECLARGDAQCRFIMAPPSRIEGHLTQYLSDPGRGPRKPWPARPTPISIPEFFQRKRLEEELRQSRDRLEQRVLERTAQLADANTALQAEMAERERSEKERIHLQAQVQHSQKLESLGVLASGVAHDFNNLLVAMMGNTDLAMAQLPADSPALPMLNKVRKTAENAGELTRQMLAYAGKSHTEIGPLNLSQAVTEIGNLLSTAIHKKAKVTYDLAADIPLIQADLSQIRQVIMNLIMNASDALCGEEGEVHVSTRVVVATEKELAESYWDAHLPAGRYVCLEVSDTGHGMDETTREKIFDPFFSTKLSSRGLGLAVVLGIVRGHRGAIQVVSAPEQGSTFRVLLPCDKAVATERESGAHVRTGTILVVDDEETVLEVTQAMLEHAGFRVVTATGGSQALEMLRAARHLRDEPVLAVLLDATMPDMSGRETLEEIEHVWPGLPVILTSGYGEQETRRRFGPGHFPSFLQKPFSAADVAVKLKEIIG